MKKKRMPSALNQKLAEALDFSLEDLELNQRGELTDSQRSRLRSQRMKAWLGAMVLLLMVLLKVGIDYQNRFDMGAASASPEVQLLLIFILLFVLAIGVFGWMIIRNTRSDLQAGEVHSVEGVAKLSEDRTRLTKKHYYVKIDSVEFRVDRDVYTAFERGKRYRAFYAPASKVLLSAIRLN